MTGFTKINEENLLEHIKSLPTLPVIFHHIISSLENQETSAETLKEIIIKDQTISSKVLMMANSAWYSLTKPVEDIKKAVVLLGFGTIRNIALSTSLMSGFSNVQSPVFDRNEFWVHSIAVAELCKYTSEFIKQKNPDKVYTAGLLHDIGRLVLYVINKLEYERVILNSVKKSTIICDAEKELLGIDHARAGYLTGKHWNFPETLLFSILHHHDMRSLDYPGPVEPQIVFFCNSLINSRKIGFSGDNTIQSLNPDHYDIPGINEKFIENCIEYAEASSEKIREFLQLILD